MFASEPGASSTFGNLHGSSSPFSTTPSSEILSRGDSSSRSGVAASTCIKYSPPPSDNNISSVFCERVQRAGEMWLHVHQIFSSPFRQQHFFGLLRTRPTSRGDVASRASNILLPLPTTTFLRSFANASNEQGRCGFT